MSTVKKSTNVKKSENLKNINVEKVKKEIAPVSVSKDKIYKFDYELLSTDQLKSKRQTARKRLSACVRDIINFSDFQKDSEKLKIRIKEFNSFYKETYTKNDLSTGSLRNKMDAKEKMDLERMLEIVKKSKE